MIHRMSGRYKASTVSSEKYIHILTPCGGRGNCAKCRDTERGGKDQYNGSNLVFSERLDEGYRLGCQVFERTAGH